MATTACFDIRNFTDRLTPAKGSNRYICPVCGGNNLTIDPNSTKYQCWSGCECRDIREAIAPRYARRQKANHAQSKIFYLLSKISLDLSEN